MKRPLITAGIIDILFPDVPGVEGCSKTFYRFVGEDTPKDQVWRKREPGGAQKSCRLSGKTPDRIIIIHIFGKIFDLIDTECPGDIPLYFFPQIYPGRDLDPGTETMGDIYHDSFPNIVNFACQHKLIPVIHIVEIYPCRPGRTLVCCSQFIVIESFRCRYPVRIGIFVIVSAGFPVSHSERDISIEVFREIEEDTGLRIKEIKNMGLVDRSKVIQFPFHAIIHIPVLQVGKECQFFHHLPCCLCKYVDIVLQPGIEVPVPAVIPVRCVLCPDDFPIVFSVILCDSPTNDQLQSVRNCIACREGQPVIAVIQPLAIDQVCRKEGVSPDNHILQPVFGKGFIRFIALIISLSVGQEEGCIDVPPRSQFLGEDHLVMILLVVVGLVIVIQEVTCTIHVLSRGIIGPVGAKRIHRYPFPCLVGPFKTREGDQFKSGFLTIITPADIKRFEF